MNNKRKNRQGPPRSPRGRVVPEGVYNNAHFMHAATSHVGDIVQVLTQSGSLWEGVFKTFSAQFEVVLEVAHRVDQEGVVAVDSVVEKLIFKPQDVVSIRAKDSDLEYATHDVFQTDSAISSKFNGVAAGNGRTGEERYLEPWDGCDAEVGEAPQVNGDALLEELELDHRANGWDANDMFRKNEEVYGVHSTYDHSLAGYTLPLQRKDTQDYRDAEAKAEEIAAEIENAASSKARIELENGDEEERFAAVVRPQDAAAAGKYVIPNKRKNMQTGKLVKPGPANNGGSPPVGRAGPAPPKDKEHRAARPHLTPPADRRQDDTFPVAALGAGAGGKSYAAQAAQGGYHVPPFPPHQQHQPPSSANKVNGEPRAPPHPRQGFPPHHHHNPPPPGDVHSRPPRHHAPPPEPRRQDDVQELRKFSQDFKLVAGAPPAPPPALPPQPQPQPPPPLNPQPTMSVGGSQPPPAPSPPEVSANVCAADHAKPARPTKHDTPNAHKQPTPAPKGESPSTEDRSAPSASPPSSASPSMERVAAIKKSTLNPNAKEFNPAAKPFTPRSPSTPNPSRPHTPGTPSGVGVGVGVGVGGVGVNLGGVSVMGPGVSYVPAPHPPPPMQCYPQVAAVPYAMMAAAAAAAQQPPAYLPHPHPALAYGAMGGGGGVAGVTGGGGQPPMQSQQQRNFRKVGVGSGMQVAAATGQPLLAPAPMQQFMPYPHPHPAPHPAQPALQYQHMVRMYHGGVGGSVGAVSGVGGGGGEVPVQTQVGYAPPPAPSPAAASPALYPPPSPAHTPHPHPHQHPHPHHHFQQPPFQAYHQVLCPLMGPGGSGAHHHHHHHLAYLNHAPPTASPPQPHPHSLQGVLVPGGGAATPGAGHP
ncbi:ataxin-2-like protein isoform X5 [Helicoverpa armigera]|uniref:ataxin-2-like protein isoform X5 n=1 Tax=Helicoverpa armigera TaxID=29058 RepID=UPI003082C374